jgi:hypothetical protein
MSEYKHGQASGTGVSDSRLVQLVQHSRTRLHDTHRAPQTLALWRDLNAVLEAEVDRRKRAVEVGAASGALQRKWAVERMAPVEVELEIESWRRRSRLIHLIAFAAWSFAVVAFTIAILRNLHG